MSTFDNSNLPGLYHAADGASRESQKRYFSGLVWYLALLVLAAAISFISPNSQTGTLASAIVFLASLGVLSWLRTEQPDEIWYNGRAVAESVKTRTWRWMMRAEPFDKPDAASDAEFLSDLLAILRQNTSLSKHLTSVSGAQDAISAEMRVVRALAAPERLALYMSRRVQDQCIWYRKKAHHNKQTAKFFFRLSIVLHGSAVFMLLLRVAEPRLELPIEVIAAAAAAVLTWVQARKYDELTYSYALTAHEITILKSQAPQYPTESDLSEYVVGSEAAFSREHTQWSARRPD